MKENKKENRQRDIRITEVLQTAVKGLWGGIFIGIAGCVYLKVGGIIGSILFSVGLLAILSTGMSLYTGIIGSCIYFKKGIEGLNLLIILATNIVGTLCVWLIVTLSKLDAEISSQAAKVIVSKMEAPYLSIFLMSFMCGVLVHLGVSEYKKQQDVRGIVILVLSVVTFVMLGAEHCIANTFYFWFAMPEGGAIKLLLMVLGNSFGAIVLAFSSRYIKTI